MTGWAPTLLAHYQVTSARPVGARPAAAPGRQITVKAPEGHSRGKGQTRPAARPHQYECRGWSGGIAVLVDGSATADRSNDLEVSVWPVPRRLSCSGSSKRSHLCCQAQRAGTDFGSAPGPPDLRVALGYWVQIQGAVCPHSFPTTATRFGLPLPTTGMCGARRRTSQRAGECSTLVFVPK